MADQDRYSRYGQRDEQNRDYRRERQSEQQQSDRAAYDDDYDSEGGSSYRQIGDNQSPNHGNVDMGFVTRRPDRSQRSPRGPQARYTGSDESFGEARYSNRERRGMASFDAESYRTGGDVGPRRHRGYGTGESTRGAYSGGSYGPGTYGVAPRREYDEDERGFFDRAGDEVASWFGDEDAARRREMDHRGRGPANYNRSDERVLEDACDRLTEDRQVDARAIKVTVEGGEVTLDGTVDNRSQKRRAEDVVHDISGVRHVQNNLRMADTKGHDASSGNDTTATDRTAGTLA